VPFAVPALWLGSFAPGVMWVSSSRSSVAARLNELPLSVDLEAELQKINGAKRK